VVRQLQGGRVLACSSDQQQLLVEAWRLR
jgi:hypothetical protein